MRRNASSASRLLSQIALILFLSGCAVQTFPTHGVLHEGLAAMVGASVESLVAKIGYPDSDVAVGGRKLYTWDHRSAFTYTVPENICRQKIVEYSTPNRPNAPVHRKLVTECEIQFRWQKRCCISARSRWKSTVRRKSPDTPSTGTDKDANISPGLFETSPTRRASKIFPASSSR